MCRSLCAISRCLRIALWGVALGILLPLTAAADNHTPRLHTVLLDRIERLPTVASGLRPRWWNEAYAYNYLTQRARRESLFHLTFVPDETFRFILPTSLIWDSSSPLSSAGTTVHAYTIERADGSIAELTIPVPNKLLRIRNTLLAAEAYFNAAADRAGLEFELAAPGKPIDIYVGYFPLKSIRDLFVRAYARYGFQEIVLRHDLSDDEIETTAIHELFHIATIAILQKLSGGKGLLWDAAAENRASAFLFEGTADWSTDEPITIPPDPARDQPFDPDTVNSYVCESFTLESAKHLFERNEYCSSLLIKYYVEQISGGTDATRPEAVLDFIARAYNLGDLTRESYLQALAEGLPTDRYAGSTWQEIWRQFYTSFAVASLVQRPSVLRQGDNHSAFHDDAFADIRRQLGYGAVRRFAEDYPHIPDQAYEQPATDDTERAERLATIRSTETLEPYAYPHIVLRPQAGLFRDTDARSVFVYVGGPADTGAFLARQQIDSVWSPDWYARHEGSFERITDFRLSEDNHAAVNEQENVSANHKKGDFIYLGLVNAGPDEAPRDMSWSYVMSPRLVGRVSDEVGKAYENVSLVGGTAQEDRRPHRFYNKDSFAFEMESTGRLHLHGDNRTFVPASERSLNLSIVCGESSETVLLAEEDGERLRVDVSRIEGDRIGASLYRYRVSGRIDENNEVTGDCRVRVNITSLLNLGSGDRQVDESYQVRIGDPRPEVARFIIVSDGEAVYDSTKGVLRPAKAVDGVYRLGLTVRFSTELSENGASITAGATHPYDGFEVPIDTSLSDAPFWTIWSQPGDGPEDIRTELQTEIFIPEADFPSGGLLWFSIMAESKAGILLDADPLTDLNQRDTRHFALLGIDDFYLATMSAETQRTFVSEWPSSTQTGRYEYGPFETQFILVPDAEDWVVGKFELPAVLTSWQRLRTDHEEFLSAARRELSEARAVLDAQENDVLPNAADVDRPGVLAEIASLRETISHLKQEMVVQEGFRERWNAVDPDFRVLMRLLQGAGIYWCRWPPENGEAQVEIDVPLRTRFAGMGGEYREERRAPDIPYEATLSYQVDAWDSANDASLNWDVSERAGRAYRYICPQLSVWRYDLEDLERFHELALSPPMFSGETTSDIAMESRFVDALTKVYSFALRFTVDSFEPRLEGFPPVLITRMPLTVALPPLQEGPLMRIFRSNESLGQGHLIRGEGSSAYSWGGGESGNSNFTVEREGGHTFVNPPDALQVVMEVNADLLSRFLPWPEASGVSWALEEGTGPQVTNYTTHPTAWWSQVIIGWAPEGWISGAILGESHTTEDWFGGTRVQRFTTRYGWEFEHNGRPGEPVPAAEEPQVAELLDPDPPDDNQSGELDGQEPERLPPDDVDDPPDDSDQGANRPEPPADPEPDEARDDPEQGTVDEPTLQHSGVVQGIISNASSRFEPGHVTVYLVGDALPSHDGQPLQIELNAGFPRSFVTVPVGGSIRIHNGEGVSGPAYTIFSESDDVSFEHVLPPGEEAVIDLMREGRLKVRLRSDPADILSVLVVPSTRFNLLETASYIIRDVPAGRYLLRAVTESRRYRPFEISVDVSESGRLTRDITLVERGAQTAGQ
jgi:hypothetical protein